MLSLLVAVRVLLAGLTPFGSDFMNWVRLGADVVSGRRYFGVYTGPAYIYAAFYFLWLLITQDSGALNRVWDLFSFQVVGPKVVSFPFELFAFSFFMKIPLLLADTFTMIALFFIMRTITKSVGKSLTAVLLWAGSPYVFLAELVTVVDIFPALLILLGVYSIYRSKIKIGSVLLAAGSLMRLAPLLFMWIYVVAFVRMRQLKALTEFLAVQLLIFAAGILYVSLTAGKETIFQLFGGRPGVIVDETLSSMGMLLVPRAGSFILPLSMIAYGVLAYFFTKPSVWKNRMMGSEVLVFFAAYFATSSFFPHFFLWALPLFVVYSLSTRFGIRRFWLSTTIGFAFMVMDESKFFSGWGKAVFLVPNMNLPMMTFSWSLYGLDSLTFIIAILRSLFAASLVLVVLSHLMDGIAIARGHDLESPNR